uniref:Uncharacterized protein n=1 Tax=Geospiza parvula TaxID=87175 RepID=A0A8U8BL12_GEOPR
MGLKLCRYICACVAGLVGGDPLKEFFSEVLVKAGQQVVLPCHMEADDMSDSNMYWYCQGPRGSLEWIYEDNEDTSGGFQDYSKGILYSVRTTLQILAATPGDAAMYYCSSLGSADLVHLAWAPVQHGLISPLCLALAPSPFSSGTVSMALGSGDLA